MPGPFLEPAVAPRRSGVPLTARVPHCKPAVRGASSSCHGDHRVAGSIAAPRSVSCRGAEQGPSRAALYLLRASVFPAVG